MKIDSSRKIHPFEGDATPGLFHPPPPLLDEDKESDGWTDGGREGGGLKSSKDRGRGGG